MVLGDFILVTPRSCRSSVNIVSRKSFAVFLVVF